MLKFMRKIRLKFFTKEHLVIKDSWFKNNCIKCGTLYQGIMACPTCAMIKEYEETGKVDADISDECLKEMLEMYYNRTKRG